MSMTTVSLAGSLGKPKGEKRKDVNLLWWGTVLEGYDDDEEEEEEAVAILEGDEKRSLLSVGEGVVVA
jgi:hypothetical protein